MTRTLLDTNVVSELMRKNPSPRVLDWLDSREVTQLWMASITVTEIERGILRLADSERAVQLRTLSSREVQSRAAWKSRHATCPTTTSNGLRW